MVTVRDWQDDDTDWWVEQRRRWDPTMSVVRLRLIASGAVGRFVTRRVAVENDVRLGVGLVVEPTIQGYSTNVIVDPRARSQGVGSLLWREVMDVVTDEPLFTFLPDRDERGIAISEHWGFRTVTHGIVSRIDLTGPLPQPNLPAGMTVRVIRASDPGAPDVGLGELIADTGDYPEAAAMGWKGTLAAFDAAFSDITWVLVEDGSTVAAAASMSALAGPGGSEWAVVFTGTRSTYRGRGLSRVAKQTLHQLAARRGATGLSTTNEAGNTGIRALNASLGYRVMGGEVRMVRQVNVR